MDLVRSRANCKGAWALTSPASRGPHTFRKETSLCLQRHHLEKGKLAADKCTQPASGGIRLFPMHFKCHCVHEDH